MQDSFKIEEFVVRFGDWDGNMLADRDNQLAIHKFSTTCPSIEYQTRQVIAVDEAVRVDLDAIA